MKVQMENKQNNRCKRDSNLILKAIYIQKESIYTKSKHANKTWVHAARAYLFYVYILVFLYFVIPQETYAIWKLFLDQKFIYWTLEGEENRFKRRRILFARKSFWLDCKEKWKIRLIGSIFHRQHHYLSIKTRLPLHFLLSLAYRQADYYTLDIF